jgi:catechol 2,3-dioxygenase-like lactoylglutathione lyase family enzyme
MNRSLEIKGLHHSAYRCRDSEETRAFYEDFLGLPLAKTLPIGTTKTGRQTQALHTFYRLGDGSFLAFFEAPGQAFEFHPQHDYDLHIALEVSAEVQAEMLARGKAAGIETRGPAEHDFIRSIYFRDPNGYVIELTVKSPDHDRKMDPESNDARKQLDAWQAAKAPVAE